MHPAPDEGWSEPRIVDKYSPPPWELGEMKQVRAGWRDERLDRTLRRLWPAFVAVLVIVIVVCLALFLVGPGARF